jgi:uncharacterized membrane protein YdbT with pleckstrin-like domain
MLSLRAAEQRLLLSSSVPDHAGITLLATMLAIAPAIALAVIMFREWLRRATTKIVITDHRVLFKVGLIWRSTQEMNITKIESVDVDQGIWGRIPGFGSIKVHGTGGGWEPLRDVDDPVAMRNAIMVG